MNQNLLFRHLAITLTALITFAAIANAHGPQMQVTNESGKIVTRRIILDGPYHSLTDEAELYVVPVEVTDGVTYARPNPELDSLTGVPKYISGPGLAYGMNVIDNSFQPFASDSVLSIEFADRLLKWSGSDFVDAGATELKAYRGSNPEITAPPENVAVTSDDTSSFDSVSISPISSDYNEEAHATVRYAFLGDGTELETLVEEGLYLATMRVTSTQADLDASDPYYFLLNHGGTSSDVSAAIASLGISSSRIQYVPEPTGFGPLLCIFVALLTWVRARHNR